MKKVYLPSLFLIFNFFLNFYQTMGQPLIAWNSNGLNSFGSSPFAPTSINANLTSPNGGLTRASGIGTASTAAANAWGGTITNATNSSSVAIGANQYVYFHLKSNPGYKFSASQLNLFYRRSTTGPAHGLLQWSINGSNTFSDIATLNFSSTSSSGSLLTPISLTSIPGLQNVNSLTTIIFRIVLYGDANIGVNGTWYAYSPSPSQLALSIDGSVSSESLFISNGIGGGDWHNGNSWIGGVAPGSGDNVQIKSGDIIYINNATGDVTRNAGTYTIVEPNASLQIDKIYTNNGATYVDGEFQLNSNTGCYVSGNEFDYGPAGTLAYNSLPYTVNFSDPSWPFGADKRPFNVLVKQNTTNILTVNANRTIDGLFETYGGILITGGTNNVTINGTFRLKGSSFVGNSSSAPFYGPSSTLEYATGFNYNRNSEWSNSLTPTVQGYPNNVLISNGTTLTMDQNSGMGTIRGMSGSLTINTGCTFNMGILDAPIIVTGNVTNSGLLNLGSTFNGDLKIGGNFTNNGTFNPNNRAVFFTGANGVQPQLITSPSPLTIPYIVFETTIGTTVQLNTPKLNITAPNGDAIIKFGISGNDILDLNGKNLALGSTYATNFISNTGKFKGSIASELQIMGSGNIGTMDFSPEPNLSRLIIDRTPNTLGLVLGSSLTLNYVSTTWFPYGNCALHLNQGLIDIGSNNLIFKSGAIHNAERNFSSAVKSWIISTGLGEIRTSLPFINDDALGTKLFSFPIGDNSPTGYSPALIVQNSYSGTGYIAMKLKNTVHPEVQGNEYIKRYWKLSTSGITALDYDIALNYRNTDVVGAEANLKQNIWNTGTLSWGTEQLYIGNSPYFNTPSIYYTNQSLPTAPIDFTKANIFHYTGVYFRSHQNGDWTDVNTWECSLDGGLTYPYWPSPVTPNSNNAASGQIEVRDSHTVTITSPISMSNCFVRSGGILKTTNPGSQYNIGGTNNGVHLTIESGGILSIDVAPPNGVLLGDGTALVKTNGLIRMENGTAGLGFITDIYLDSAKTKFYYENNAQFESDNTILVLGSSGTQQFFRSNGIPILRFSRTPVSPFGSSTNTYINGMLEIGSGTTLKFNYAGTKTIKGGIRGSGILNQLNGTGQIILKNNSIIDSTIKIYTFSNGMATEASSTVTVPLNADVKIISSAEDNIFAKGANSIININGTADVTGLRIINNDGAVNVSSTGTIKTANSNGLYGTSATIPSGSLSLASGSSVVYNKNGGNQDITSQTALYHHLVLDSAGTKKAPAGLLPIKGNFTIKANAVFTHNNGTVRMDGTAAQYFINNNAPVEPLFYNIDFANNNGVFVQNAISIKKKLNIPIGTLNVNDIITMKSLPSPDNTSNIGDLNNATINYGTNGNFRIERYIQTPRKWQLLSVPTNKESAPTTPRESWQENQTYISGYGTKLTDSTLDAVTSRGFDQITGGPSVKYFVPGSPDKFLGIDNTLSFDLSDRSTTAYYVFPYGDRTMGFPTVPTTLRTTGRIYQGDQTSRNIDANKYDFIGNPYASTVDMRNVTLNGSPINAYYLWDPLLIGWRGVGGYQTLTLNNGNYTIQPGGGSYGIGGTVNNYLQSGQAFLVLQGNSSGVVTFHEADKVDESATPFRISEGEHLFVSVSTQANLNNKLDGLTISFSDKYNNAVDDKDVAKMLDGDDNLSLVRNNKHLASERYGLINLTDTFYLSLNNFKSGKYNLSFIPINLANNEYKAFLKDKYKDIKHEISLSDDGGYSFEIEAAIASSAAPDRFYIVFRKINEQLYQSGSAEILVAPNPIKDNMLQLHAYNLAKGNYHFNIITTSGQLVQQGSATISDDVNFIRIPLSNISKGNYHIVLSGVDGKKYSRKFTVL